MRSDKTDIDRHFYERASAELHNLGSTAMELIQRHPDCSKKELAEIIGNGVTSRGLTMKLFEEASRQGTVATLARDLLYRRIINEFPDGWIEDEKVRSTVKLGSWHNDVHEFAPECEESAVAILRALATEHKPDLGWKPTSAEDERLRLLFETFWT